jgi:hypothetical protein
MTTRSKITLAYLPSCTVLFLILAWGIYATLFYEVPAGQPDYRMSSEIYIATIIILPLALLMLPTWLAYRKLPNAQTPNRHNLWLFLGGLIPVCGLVVAPAGVLVELTRRHVEWEGYAFSLILILPVLLPLRWVRQKLGKEQWASKKEYSTLRRAWGFYLKPHSPQSRWFKGLLATIGVLMLIGLGIVALRYCEKKGNEVWIPFSCYVSVEVSERSWVVGTVDPGGEAINLGDCVSWEMSIDELEPGWTWQRVGETFQKFRDNPPDVELSGVDGDDIQQLLPYLGDVRSVRLYDCPELNESQEQHWENTFRAAGVCVLQGRRRH